MGLKNLFKLSSLTYDEENPCGRVAEKTAGSFKLLENRGYLFPEAVRGKAPKDYWDDGLDYIVQGFINKAKQTFRDVARALGPCLFHQGDVQDTWLSLEENVKACGDYLKA